MEPPDVQMGQEAAGSQRRSPLDIIMNQIRRRRPASDRKSLGRFLARASDRTAIPEDAESENKERSQGAVASEESEREAGWGRVCVFLLKLGKKADSRSLNLAHCDLTATDLLELASVLHFLPQLEEVDISWNELIGGSLTTLTSHLQHAAGIRTLRLCSCRLNVDDVAALGEVLTSFSFLEILDLSWNASIGGGALQGLLGKPPPTLRELHLVACQLTAADAAALGVLLSALPKLSMLDVSCNPRLAQEVESGGFGELAASLSHAVSLTSLRLQGCGLTPCALDALGNALRCLPSVRELDLSCNRSLVGGLSRLAVHLPHMTHLESLDLHLCRLSRSDLEALIQVLPSLASLMTLDVSSNKESGGAVDRLVAALPLTRMTRLPLSSCRLTEESFSALALAAPYLRCVDVSWSKAVGGRLALLLDALQQSVVMELRLSSCGLNADDLRHLADVCRRGCFSSLRVLDLSYNGSVEDAGWAALFTAGGLGSLEEADVSLRPLTSAPCSAWLPALLGALPRMQALARLAMERWSLGSLERQRLRHSVKSRNIRLDWDPDGVDWKTGSQEESLSEE